MSDISVIIPTYNDAKTLTACIESVLSQTLAAKEIIIVNDGSTDETADILTRYALRSRNISVINQKNEGRARARTNGASRARGEFIIFIDSDMTFVPDVFEKLIYALLQNPNASYAYSSLRLGLKQMNSFNFDANKLRKNNFIHIAAMIRKMDFPGFDLNIKRFQDWDLWLTMLEQGKAGVFVPDVIFDATSDIGALSKWVPKFAYSLPWKYLGFFPKRVKDYLKAKEVIIKKHNL